MNVLVTGSNGQIGRYVVQELVQAGHHVTGVDIVPAPGNAAHFMRADMTDTGDVYQSLAHAQAEAVVHLGAWSNAGLAPDHRVYGDNVRATYNVLQACADRGIRRVICASSAQVYGFATSPPLYLPVDEAHPLRPANCYALAKVAGESAAEYFAARHDMTVLSFRFMGVRAPARIRAEIEQMAQNPASGAWLLWTRADARDAAAACRLALEAHDPPSGPYNITGAEIVLSQSVTDLVRTAMPPHLSSAIEIRGAPEAPLSDRSSPMSCRRAQQAFGYVPRYIWREPFGRGQYHPENGAA